MKRASTKKGMDRRKRARNKSSSSRSLARRGGQREGHSSVQEKDALSNHSESALVYPMAPTRQTGRQSESQFESRSDRRPGKDEDEAEICWNCQKELIEDSRVLFVEEELRRIFCSEACISDYFLPETEKLEKDYLDRLSPGDFSADEREVLAHLRWITLQEPDEAWCQETSEGDLIYTLISEFRPGKKRVWSVCVCLCLRGEPSFLFLAFTTRDQTLMNFFRRGDKQDWSQRNHAPSMDSQLPVVDGLANSWTEDETIRAELGHQRREDDISVEEFELYQGCLDSTLQNPDEVWSRVLFEENERKLYHFIRYFPEENLGVWYLVVAKETDEGDQIEILEAFPSRDHELVQRYRSGSQEVGNSTPLELRVIH